MNQNVSFSVLVNCELVKTMKLKPILSILLLAFAISASAAQRYSSVKFKRITTEDGLSDDFTECILQDKYGYIWIGTRNGLNRFDGYSMKVYRKIPINKNSLTSNFVYRMLEDSHGNLWIGTLTGGLLLYNRENDEFKSIPLKDEKEESIFSIVEDKDSTLWIGTFRGVVHYDPRTNTILPFSTNSIADEIIKSNRILDIHFDASNCLWFATQGDAGLIMLNRENDSCYVFKNTQEKGSIGENNCIRIVENTEGRLLIATLNSGLYEFNRQAYNFSPIEFPDRKCDFKKMWSMIFDSKGKLWCGTINDGLYLLDFNENYYEHFVSNSTSANSLSQMSISSIMEDNSGNIWMTTHGGGVNIINKRNNLFEHYYKKDGAGALKHNFVSCFAEGENGNMWIGTDGGGLFCFDEVAGSFVQYDEKNGLKNLSITDLTKDDDGMLWIATWGSGLVKFNPKTHQFHYYVNNPDNPYDTTKINCDRLKHIHYNNGKLYISTHDVGITIFDIEKEYFISDINNPFKFKLSSFGFPQKIIKDSRGRIWIGTINGLFKIEKNELSSYYSTEKKHTIANNYISDIYEDSKGGIWIGHNYGFDKFNDKDDSFIRYGELFNVDLGVKAILEDDGGNIWLTTNNGVVEIKLKNKDKVRYSIQDGLQGNQFIQRAAFKTKEGKLYFGGLKGFNRIYTGEMEKDKNEPFVHFSDFYVNDTLQSPGETGSVLTKDVNYMDEIVLDYSQRNIAINFVGLNFTFPSQNQYAYKLEGYDKVWKKTHDRSATYTNLDPQSYVFKVRASNADGVWTNEPVELHIRVLAPWWRSWWFGLLVLMFATALVLLYIRIRVAKVRNYNKVLERKVDMRTAELHGALEIVTTQKNEIAKKNEELVSLNSMKDKFFSIIAHDLKNPLNSLIGFSDLLIGRKLALSDEKRDKYIELINKSANNLFNLLENLLEWARSQTNTLKIEKAPVDVNELIDENIELMKALAESKRIDLIADKRTDVVAFVDRTLLSTVIRNLVSNAIKFTPECGQITVSSERMNSAVVRVRDTGVGMSQEQVENLFSLDKNSSTPGTNNEKGTGLGLIIVREFIEKNNGTLSVVSDVGKGTTFTIEVPLSS